MLLGMSFCCFSLNYIAIVFYLHLDNFHSTVSGYSVEFCIYTHNIYIYSVYIYTLTGYFIRYTVLVPGWTPFCLQNLILRGIDSTRCWKHSSEILVHIDMIASHSCCRFVSRVYRELSEKEKISSEWQLCGRK